MTVQTVPYALQNASHSAALFRQATSAPFATAGVLAAGELALSQQATPNMSVILGAGRAKVSGTSVSPPSGLSFTTQAMYDTLNDANVTLTIAASNPTNPRIDAAYIQVQDSFYSGAANQAVPGVQTGTPGVSPVAPAVPTNAILIGYIAVAANATSIVAANISYQATLASVIPNARVGSTLVVPTSATPTGGSAVISALGKTTFTGVTALVVNGLTGYDNYFAVISMTAGTAAIASVQATIGGAPDTTANYDTYGGGYNQAGTGVAVAVAANTSWFGSNGGASFAWEFEADIHHLNAAAPTRCLVRSEYVTTVDTAKVVYSGAMDHRASTSFDGLKALFSNAASGTISVYGWNNG
jgi:hypothetical protein